MIAIKDFKMPENCLKCPMQFGGLCYVSPSDVVDERVAPTVDEAFEQGKPEWCPLVEVPDTVSCSEIPNSSDCVSRQAAIDAVEHITSSMSVCVNTDERHGMKRMQRQAVIELANLPSAQPEIIRCKECVYADENYHCDYMTTWNDGDCFCCYGKRRTDGRFDQ